MVNQIMAYAKNFNLSLLVLLALSHQKCVFIDIFFFLLGKTEGRGKTQNKEEKDNVMRHYGHCKWSR